MNTRLIPKEKWKLFFDGVSRSKELETKEAEIEVVGLDLGDQIAAEWVPIFGLVYESRGDVLEVSLEGYTHRIHHPRQIFLDRDGLQLASILVTDSDELRHLIRLRRPLSLPGLKQLVPSYQ